jgi:hypothetical protein
MVTQNRVEVALDERGVATVTIANAAKLNTLNSALMTGLLEAMEQLARDAALRVVILRGAGSRAFIGGADIAEMAGLDACSARAFITMVHRVCDAFRRLPVPVIARIQGHVLGAGLEVAAASTSASRRRMRALACRRYGSGFPPWWKPHYCHNSSAGAGRGHYCLPAKRSTPAPLNDGGWWRQSSRRKRWTRRSNSASWPFSRVAHARYVHRRR